ncbi:hypothetical protein D3C84_461400 [compost metagenome]
MNLFVALLVAALKVVFVLGRDQVDVAVGAGVQVLSGTGLAGDGVEVATGVQGQVARGGYAGA